MKIPVHLAVAGDVFDGVYLCCLFISRDVLDGIRDLIELVSKGFLTYPHRNNTTENPEQKKSTS